MTGVVAPWRDGGDGPVTLYRVPLTQPATTVASLREGLDDAERERAAAFGAGDAERAFVVARAALRAAVREVTGTAPVVLAIDEHHRPYVAGGPPGLDVNVTHSGDWALVAVGRGVRVGVDVERVRAVDALRIARRAFTSRESAELAALDGDALLAAFFAIWTAKEACLKAAGTGLRGGLASFDVRDPGWVVRPVSPGPGYAAALATDVAADVGYRTWSP
jgi:4'-phosphopantetheinyl transferase